MKKLFLLLTIISQTIICNGKGINTKFTILYSHFVKHVSLNIDTPSQNTAQIPIIAWLGVPENQTSLSRYQELSASGVTLSFFPFSNASKMEAALNIAQKAGIKLIATCPELTSNPEATVKRFMNHPALAGYFLKDEPQSQNFPGLGILIKRIRAVDNKHFCYVNLYPNYASVKQLGAATYQQYLNEFAKEVPAQLLSFDHYPIAGNTIASISSQWYGNLEQVSAKAKSLNIPFWGFALSTAFTSHPVPTIAGLRLQVYSNLAYGAQGIQYFTYWTASAPGMNFSNAPITRDGKETDVYKKLQEMNKEIKNLSVVFYGAKMISVTHTGKIIPKGTKPLAHLPKPIASLETDGSGAVVSVMMKGNESFLVVVNRDFTTPMNLKIKCASGVKRVSKDAISTPVNQSINTIKIEPGDIAIYKWPNSLN